jgi:hypothetical protein
MKSPDTWRAGTIELPTSKVAIVFEGGEHIAS